MKRQYLLLILICFLFSCAQKVYFFDAQKLSETGNDNITSEDFIVDSYFAGDALDYVVFELDIENNSSEPMTVSYRDISLEVYENENSRAFVLDALHKEDVIMELRDIHEQLERDKTARDIGNMFNLGLNLLVIGTTGGYGAVDAIIYSTEAAAYMMEDARSHKLLTGSLEEQIEYINEWVLEKGIIHPGEKDTWDILFSRQLHEAPATFIVELDSFVYKQDFDLRIIEEKVK